MGAMVKVWLMVPVNAKFTISVDELLRNVTEQKPRNAALINNLNEQAAERKLASLLFLSLGMATRKSLTDKFPHMMIATVSMREKCEQAFVKPRNRTLKRYKFFARKQKKDCDNFDTQ